MPYCNHCGRYIEDGILCNWCEEHALDQTQLPPEPQVPQTETPSPIPDSLVLAEAIPEETQQEILPETEETPVSESPQEPPAQPVSAKKKRYFAAPLRHFDLPSRVRSILDTPDSTASFSYRDAREGRTMACLCYLWILWVIPFFSPRKSPYIKYHLGQGLMLLLMDCLGATFFGIAWVLATILPVAAPAFAALGEVALLLSCLLKIFGIVCALQGKAKELPLVGTYGRHA